MVAFYIFTSIYIASRPKTGVHIGKMMGIRVEVLLFLIGAVLISLFLPTEARLQQVFHLAI